MLFRVFLRFVMHLLVFSSVLCDFSRDFELPECFLVFSEGLLGFWRIFCVFAYFLFFEFVLVFVCLCFDALTDRYEIYRDYSPGCFWCADAKSVLESVTVPEIRGGKDELSHSL